RREKPFSTNGEIQLSHIARQPEMITRTGTTGTQPAHQPAAPAPKGPVVNVTQKPVGPPADRWEGVGVNSNPAAYQSKPGVPATSPAAIVTGEKQIANLDPQISRIYVDPN